MRQISTGGLAIGPVAHRVPTRPGRTMKERMDAEPATEASSATPFAGNLHFELYSTSFCGACRQTRMVLDRVLQLLPGSTLSEHDLAVDPQRAETLNIEHSPTTIIRDGQGVELSRATGVPSVPQVLLVAARSHGM